MGDSGGYQIGTGALKGFDVPDVNQVAALWRNSPVREFVLRWLEMHCDCAMTLDLPLWVKLKRFEKSPFHALTTEMLADLTVDNLRYFANNRGRFGSCDFLNVLHGGTEDEENYWYQRVREFDFEGWAIGGSVGAGLDLPLVLRRLLLLRDDKMLGGSKRWLHILGMSQLKWAVVLTAIQRAVQKVTGGEFGVSFDTSTPMLSAGRFQRLACPPTLTNEICTWAIRYEPFPTGYLPATKNAQQAFPPGSPLSSLLTLGDMNPKKSPYAAQTFDEFSFIALANHNTFVLLSALIEANKAAFGPGPNPQVLAELLGTIGDLFASEQWSSLLATAAPRIAALLGTR
jgi:hypothetical protein